MPFFNILSFSSWIRSRTEKSSSPINFWQKLLALMKDCWCIESAARVMIYCQDLLAGSAVQSKIYRRTFITNKCCNETPPPKILTLSEIQTHISSVNMMNGQSIFPLKMSDDNAYFYDSLIHLKLWPQQCDSQSLSDRVQGVNTLCIFPG